MDTFEIELEDSGPATTSAPTPNAGGPRLRAPKGYKAVRFLSAGDQGEVWEAVGPGNVSVALKLVRLSGELSEAERQSLRAVKDIRHPHLVSVHAIWERGGCLTVAMDLADGSLADRLRESPGGLPSGEVLGAMRDVAEGLDHLNDPSGGGLLHCDVKPSNLLVYGGRVRVADFGLAKPKSRSVEGMTLAYAAPELFKKKAGRTTDQYSLAVTYYKLRTDRLPFEKDNHAAWVYAHLHLPPDLSRLEGAEERVVVKRALSKQPETRWEDCRTFVAALEAAVARDAGELRDAAGVSGRRWAVPAACVVAILALLIWIFALYRDIRELRVSELGLTAKLNKTLKAKGEETQESQKEIDRLRQRPTKDDVNTAVDTALAKARANFDRELSLAQEPIPALELQITTLKADLAHTRGLKDELGQRPPLEEYESLKQRVTGLEKSLESRTTELKSRTRQLESAKENKRELESEKRQLTSEKRELEENLTEKSKTLASVSEAMNETYGIIGIVNKSSQMIKYELSWRSGRTGEWTDWIAYTINPGSRWIRSAGGSIGCRVRFSAKTDSSDDSDRKQYWVPVMVTKAEVDTEQGGPPSFNFSAKEDGTIDLYSAK